MLPNDQHDPDDPELFHDRVQAEGTLILSLDAVVCSPGGSGVRQIWEYAGRWHFLDDSDGWGEPREPGEDALRAFEPRIHTGGDWTIDGTHAEQLLDRIEVYGLLPGDEPFEVTVNGQRWLVSIPVGGTKEVWQGPLGRIGQP